MDTGKTIVGHELVDHDQTSYSEVALCQCGRSFLGGVASARAQWRTHATGETGTTSPHPAKHTPASTLSELVAGIDPRHVVLSVPWTLSGPASRKQTK